ncbi:MAG: ABC transporter substrate-binding protein [Nitrospirota bacterium]
MSKVYKKILGILVIVLVVSTVCAFAAKGDKGTFKIGIVAPFSLDYAFLGESIRNSILMARDELENSRFNYEFIFEDSQNDAKLDAGGAHKLIDVDKVDAIISFGSTSGPIVTPIATESKTLHYSISVQPYISEGLTNFIHWAPSKALNGTMAEEMKKRGIRKYGVLRSTTWEGWAIYKNDLLNRAKELGLEMVTDQTFQADTSNFRTQIAKARKAGAEIYVLYCGSPALEILGQQLREAGDNTPLTSVGSFDLTTNKKLFEGQWYVGAAQPNNAFITAYKKRYDKEPAVAGPNAYDIMKLIDHAISNTGSDTKPSSEQIANELLKIRNFPGALGNLSIVDTGITMSDVDVKMIKNGEPVKVGG